MAFSQQKFREIVFQLLYSEDIAHPNESLMTKLMMGELAVSKKNVRLAQERVQMIKEHLPEIDSLITSISISYDFNRIQIVTKNILRLAIFELLFDDQVPSKVAIAEAIRLSRKFNTPESASFVNAILDHLYQAREGKQVDNQTLSQYSQSLLESEKIASDIALEESLRDEELDDNSERNFPHDLDDKI